MSLSTPLYRCHLAEHATFVNFGGWNLPLHYGSQSEEHLAVRRSAGMFDVSHMGILDLDGARVRELLALILANDVARLQTPGSALYTCMLLPDGGVIDDLIVYYIADGSFRLIVNAAASVLVIQNALKRLMRNIRSQNSSVSASRSDGGMGVRVPGAPALFTR